jgi:hypothetical protein
VEVQVGEPAVSPAGRCSIPTDGRAWLERRHYPDLGEVTLLAGPVAPSSPLSPLGRFGRGAPRTRRSRRRGWWRTRGWGLYSPPTRL